jgi:phage-related protein
LAGDVRSAWRIGVLHAFQKSTQQTAQRDIELAAKRLREWKAQQ